LFETLGKMVPGGLKSSEGQFVSAILTTILFRASSIAETAKDNPVGAVLEAGLYVAGGVFVVFYGRMRTNWKQTILAADSIPQESI